MLFTIYKRSHAEIEAYVNKCIFIFRVVQCTTCVMSFAICVPKNQEKVKFGLSVYVRIMWCFGIAKIRVPTFFGIRFCFKMIFDSTCFDSIITDLLNFLQLWLLSLAINASSYKGLLAGLNKLYVTTEYYLKGQELRSVVISHNFCPNTKVLSLLSETKTECKQSFQATIFILKFVREQCTLIQTHR